MQTLDDEAMDRWRAVLARTPAHLPALLGLTRAHAARGEPEAILRLAEQLGPTTPLAADSILQAAIRALPQDPALGLAFCHQAEAQGDAIQADLRWAALYRRQPTLRAAHLGHIRSALAQRRIQAAEAAAQRALELFTNDPELLQLMAEMAERRRDWSQAAQRWARLADAHPDHPRAHAARQEAAARDRFERHSTLPPGDLVTPIAPIPRLTSAEEPAIKELLAGFESLGADCEFGKVQRRFGGEPLGLLRFASTPPQSIVTLLTTRFEGIGDPDQMAIRETPKEYRMRHPKSGWGMHTRIKPGPDHPIEAVYKAQCRNAAFLRKKLIKELEQQSKIFVHKDAALTDQDIGLVYHAVQSYGPNMLLCVRVADASHPAGSIEWRTERLMVAAIDKIGGNNRGAGWNISFAYWVHFCRLMRARHDALATPEPAV